MIQSAVNAANDLWREQQGVEDAVTNLNKALSYGTPKVKNRLVPTSNIATSFKVHSFRKLWQLFDNLR